MRSIETGRLIGKKIIEDSIFREAEIPLIVFPPVRLKAKLWLFISRSLWLLGLKTKCESFKEVRQRVKRIVETIELKLLENERIVIIGHGFINALKKKELLHRGWFLTQVKYEDGFLNRMNFQPEPPNAPDAKGRGSF